MAHAREPGSWPRTIAIAFAVFAAYAGLGVVTLQDSPEDPPLIVSLSQNEESAGAKPRAQISAVV